MRERKGETGHGGTAGERAEASGAATAAPVAQTSGISVWLLGVRPYLLLAALCAILYLPGLSTIPPLDRDEARFAQATRQMLETGDFLRIRFQDEARNKKPAGIYWLQAASVKLFSSADAKEIWPYRVPSLLGAMAAVLLTFGLGAALLRGDGPARAAGAVAAVLLAACLGTVAEAHIAKSDAALLGTITAAQGALGLAYARSRGGGRVAPWIAAVFWAAEIVAIMIKGPVGPALAVVTAATLSIADGNARWLRTLRPVIGIIAVIAAVTPWLIAIQDATGGRFLNDSLGSDLWRKIIDTQESHGAPPFAYLGLSLITFWPGSLLIAPALIRAWQHRESPAERFLLAWLVPSWVLLELVPTKLPHYVLPLYPALALMAALALNSGRVRLSSLWGRRLELGLTVLWAAVGVAVAAVLVVLPLRFGGHFSIAGFLGGIVLLVLVALILRYRRSVASVVIGAAATLVFAVTASWAVLPGLDQLWLSRSAARLVAQHPPPPGAPLVSVGYSEPSLVFLLGTDLHLASPRMAIDLLATGGEALVSSREDPIFRQTASAHGLVALPLGSIPGTDYSNGQRMVLTLYKLSRP